MVFPDVSGVTGHTSISEVIFAEILLKPHFVFPLVQLSRDVAFSEYGSF
jgi:hypothetical protein